MILAPCGRLLRALGHLLDTLGTHVYARVRVLGGQCATLWWAIGVRVGAAPGRALGVRVRPVLWPGAARFGGAGDGLVPRVHGRDRAVRTAAREEPRRARGRGLAPRRRG